MKPAKLNARDYAFIAGLVLLSVGIADMVSIGAGLIAAGSVFLWISLGPRPKGA